MSTRNDATLRQHLAAEVEWYRQHGKHPDRITRNHTGTEYVIGDWSWNRQHPDRREMIESFLPRPQRIAR